MDEESTQSKYQQVTHRNHYIPRAYLKRWTESDGKVAVHRLVVPNSNVREWRRTSPAGIGYHSNLYTRIASSGLSDEVEQWIARDFENPADSVITSAVNGDRLSSDDWSALIRFAACQDVRTPARLFEVLKRQKELLPDLLQQSLVDIASELEKAHAEGRILEPVVQDPSSKEIPSRITIEPNLGGEKATLRYETVIGRATWLHTMKHVLTQTVQALHAHRWTIIRSPRRFKWLTSDNPVIRLAYKSETDYNFGGGWGRKGSEIILPLGPEHVLYTKVGDSRPPMRDSRCEQWFANAIQRFTIENAHRMIFAVEPDLSVAQIRPRLVDAAMFRHEQAEWRDWHEKQVTAEQNLAQ